MKNKRLKSFFVILLSMCGALTLTSCDKSRVTKTNETKISNKRVCVSVAGGTYGVAGLRARQFVGKGPKMRVVQWKTADFQDDLQIVENKDAIGKKPNIAVQISWRVDETKKALESSFESLDAYSLNLTPEQSAAVAYWRFTIYDGENTIVTASKAIDGKVRDLFSADNRGIVIPANVGEALGGINGGRFEIALLDSNKNEIVKRFVVPSRGYEFKDAAKPALDGLAEVLKNPDNCQIPSTQLRTQ